MTRPIEIFMAYSRADTEFLQNFRKHFSPLERRGRVKIWYDGEIVAGEVWETAIKTAIHKADIILLLVSADSLASDYFYEQEVSNALARHKAGEAKVVPVILRACTWRSTELADLQALPKDGKPLNSWTDTDEAYANTVEGVLKIVEECERVVSMTNANQADSKSIETKVDEFRSYLETAINPSFKMIAIPAGAFIMGSPDDEANRGNDEAQHEVSLSAFYIGETPITQAQWYAVMGTNPSEGFASDDCPVENVSWDDIQDFLLELNTKSSRQYRLPTEAEWEYAARGGQPYQYSGSNKIDDVAWYDSNSGGKTHSVKDKRANAYGLYDMSGNVWEWCCDWYGTYANNSQTNPQGASSGTNRVYRGGSWGSRPGYCRVAARRGGAPSYRSSYFGFRLVCSPL